MNILTLFAHAGHIHTNEVLAQSTTTAVDEAAAAAVIVGILLFSIAFTVACYVISALCLMQIFKKAGVAQWIAWVPFYNNWKTLEIGGQQGFWAVLVFIPLVNIASAVFMYIAMYNIGLKLGHSGAFFLLAFFLTPIWLIVLALEKNPWDDTKGAPSLATSTNTQPPVPTPPAV